jgi:hypothetical protein
MAKPRRRHGFRNVGGDEIAVDLHGQTSRRVGGDTKRRRRANRRGGSEAP